MIFRGRAGLGEARHGAAGRGRARLGSAGQGRARQGTAWLGKAGQGWARQGNHERTGRLTGAMIYEWQSLFLP